MILWLLINYIVSHLAAHLYLSYGFGILESKRLFEKKERESNSHQVTLKEMWSVSSSATRDLLVIQALQGPHSGLLVS